MTAKKSKAMCKDCGERYAQELGRCRRCWNARIEGKTLPNRFRPEPLPSPSEKP